MRVPQAAVGRITGVYGGHGGAGEQSGGGGRGGGRAPPYRRAVGFAFVRSLSGAAPPATRPPPASSGPALPRLATSSMHRTVPGQLQLPFYWMPTVLPQRAEPLLPPSISGITCSLSGDCFSGGIVKIL